MKWLFIFLILLVSFPNIIFAEVELADGTDYLEPEIRIYIEDQATKHDVHYVYVSKVVRGDINGDQKKDVFVSYAIEGIGGGNFTLFNQALFLNEQDKMTLKAKRSNGSSGTAQGITYIPKKIVIGKVICETLSYAPDDGVCCPSIKGKGEILFKDGKLVENKIKKQPQRASTKK